MLVAWRMMKEPLAKQRSRAPPLAVTVTVPSHTGLTRGPRRTMGGGGGGVSWDCGTLNV